MEEIRQLAMRDNTMGASLLDKTEVLTSSSIGEIRNKLVKIQSKKEKAEASKQQQMMELERQKIASQEAMMQERLEWEKERHYTDLENRVDVAEMRALGSTQFAQGTGLDDILKLKQQQLKEESYYQDILDKAKTNQLKKEQLNSQLTGEQSLMESKESIEREKIKLEREKNLTKLKISDNELKIAKENKP